MGAGHGESTVHAVAGAVAGGVARTVVSPLDVIKIRFQVFSGVSIHYSLSSDWIGSLESMECHGLFVAFLLSSAKTVIDTL